MGATSDELVGVQPAARVVGLDLEDISVHLDDLFDLLPQAARRADGAQRSLRATVDPEKPRAQPEDAHSSSGHIVLRCSSSTVASPLS